MTFTLVTGASEKALIHVFCIHYSIWFQKNKGTIYTLIDFGSKVNAMLSVYAKKLGLQIWKTNIGAQKINRSTLFTFEMVIAEFQVQNKLGRARFFQETFLVVNTSIEVVFKMLFLTFSNADVGFLDKKLTWSTYSITETLPTTKRL